MAILDIQVHRAGEIGSNARPRRVTLLVTDSLATATSAGYLNNVNVGGYIIAPTDVIDLIYDYNEGTGVGSLAVVTPTISGATDAKTITLNEWQNPASANLSTFDVTATSATLASAAQVALITAQTGDQFKLRNLFINAGGVNFAGGGGDRLLDITDGTSVYAQVSAANLQALPGNRAWGSVDLAFPAFAMNTSTVAGQNLRAVYSGGSADYTSGSITITGVYEKVA